MTKASFIAVDNNKTITNSYTNHAIDLHNNVMSNITQEDPHISQLQDKKCQKSAISNEASFDNTYTITLREHIEMKIDNVITIPFAANSKSTFVNDFINLEGNIEHSSHDSTNIGIMHMKHNIYLQKLQSLSENTIMIEVNENNTIQDQHNLTT
ncbi:hypothetical protein RCL_jg27803.t1 [Rhizophagus clarus]|uniref:Uncharacterized protein n=1 Tax=Rhizophagus clarus TaxID=94130 RepID=A0A8H3QKP1_9GLOM|nr:hypothetical protein RCL_jg27803.t1 [Rhizophagus clarus]